MDRAEARFRLVDSPGIHPGESSEHTLQILCKDRLRRILNSEFVLSDKTEIDIVKIFTIQCDLYLSYSMGVSPDSE